MLGKVGVDGSAWKGVVAVVMIFRLVAQRKISIACPISIEPSRKVDDVVRCLEFEFSFLDGVSEEVFGCESDQA